MNRVVGILGILFIVAGTAMWAWLLAMTIWHEAGDGRSPQTTTERSDTQ